MMIWKVERESVLRTAKGYLMAAFVLSLPGILPAQQVAIGFYPVAGGPGGITAGPDGALWFTEINGNKIGRMTTSGVVTTYPVPTAGSYPDGIAVGPDGALWFTEYYGQQIGRMTTDGVVTEYPMCCYPTAITAGPDGALWVVGGDPSWIGRITTAGVVTQYFPPSSTGIYGITAGSDGALWFTEYDVSKIGRITTAGVITEYPIAGGASGITAGPDGALWFTDTNGIGRITTAGIFSEYPWSVPNGICFITTGPDAALWFTGCEESEIGRITTAGVITTYSYPYKGNGPGGITAGPNRALWFTDLYGGIGEAVFVTAGLSVSPASGFPGTTLTFTGSAFAPNESVKIHAGFLGSPVLATATADASGSFTRTAPELPLPYGSRQLLGVGQNSHRIGAASFSVTPRLILSPNSGTVGGSAVAEGLGFVPGEQVRIHWNNPLILLGTATANQDGTFNGAAALQFTVPSGAPPGANLVFGVGSISNVKVKTWFNVE
jgi:streptogramin lyase